MNFQPFSLSARLSVVGGLFILLAGNAAAQTTGTTDAGSSVRALLAPRIESTLSSQISARIEKIHVEDGARFKKDDPLITFDCRIFDAQLRKAVAEAEGARRTFEANQQLARQQAVSNLEVAISSAQLKKAEADTALMRAQVDMCRINAPFAGRVVKVEANPFETVTAGQPLIRILDSGRLKLSLFIPSKWLLAVEPGTPFRLRIDETNRDYPAKITALGARIDPVSQTIEVTGEIDGEFAELIAGMSGVAEFGLPQ